MKIRMLAICLCFIPLFVNAQEEKVSVDELSQEKESILHLIDSLETRLKEIDQQLSKTDPVAWEKAMIAKWGKNKGKMIAQGKVWQTISSEMAIDAWGKPEKIQKSETSGGTTEKWMYPDNRYLFFKNGRLDSWRD